MNEKELIEEIVDFLIERKVTIRGMSGENVIVTDHETGEEYVYQDLGYPL